MKKSLMVVPFVLLILLSGNVAGQDWEFDVPYVPTKHSIVAEMLRMAEVGRDDILYDLGCGDGRIVVTAAKETGTRGVGIDINPVRIQESRENAKKQKVENLVRFVEKDIFEADFSEATVVSLYLLTEVNLRLRPRLLSNLKPGTRVVSHNYAMGDWEYHEYKELMVENEKHYVYFWIVPANTGGTWEWTLPAGTGDKRYAMKLNQKFQNVDGIVTTGGEPTSLKNAKLTGNKLQFAIEQYVNGSKELLYFDGKVAGNSIDGTVKSISEQNTKNYRWSARRDSMTVKPLDIAY